MRKYEGNQGKLEEVAAMLQADPTLGGVNQAFSGPPEAVARVKVFLDKTFVATDLERSDEMGFEVVLPSVPPNDMQSYLWDTTLDAIRSARLSASGVLDQGGIRHGGDVHGLLKEAEKELAPIA